MKSYATSTTDEADAEDAELEPVGEEIPVREVPVETVQDDGDTAQGEAEPSNSLSSAFQDSLNRDQTPERPRSGNRPASPAPRPQEPMVATADENPAVEEAPAEPQEPADEPEAEPPAEAMPAEVADDEAPAPKPRPTEPSPIGDELLEKVNAASVELGPIGAEIPEETPPIDQPVTPVGDIDLSPAEDTQTSP